MTEVKRGKVFGLSGNALKIIGAITMLIDHTGMILFPEVNILRIIGRISFPIFSFMICEGCKYTRNKLAYFLRIFILGIVTSLVYFLESGELYFNVLVTFSLSIVLVFAANKYKNSGNFKEGRKYFALLAMGVAAAFLITYFIQIDYGFFGVMLPVFPGIVKANESKGKILFFEKRFSAFAIGLLILCVFWGEIQIFGMISLLFIGFYNGKRGFKIPKYSFYVFYPLHLAVLWLISITLCN